MPRRQIAALTTCTYTDLRRYALDDEDLSAVQGLPQILSGTEIALPATALKNRAIAKWVRDHRVTIDVHSGEELATALAAGVQLQRLTLYADALSESDLHAAVNLGVGRVVAASVQQIELMRSVVAKRAQDVVIRMTDVNTPGSGHSRSRRSGPRRIPVRQQRIRHCDQRRFSITSGSTWSGCIARSARKTTTSSATRRRSVT